MGRATRKPSTIANTATDGDAFAPLRDKTCDKKAKKTNTYRSHAPRGNADNNAPALNTAHRNDTKTINCLQLHPITANKTPHAIFFGVDKRQVA